MRKPRRGVSPRVQPQRRFHFPDGAFLELYVELIKFYFILLGFKNVMNNARRSWRIRGSRVFSITKRLEDFGTPPI